LSRTGHRYSFIISILLLFLLSGCSVEKNTGASRFYHGLTARYNIYFNGYESYRAGIEKVNTNHRDDFGELLMVFEYSNPASATACAADMDNAIKKASKLISLKSITAKPEKSMGETPAEEEFLTMKEYNRWVDDSYLLMAKARFYIREYDQARATIAFNNDISTNPEVKTEGMIWLARIQIEAGNSAEALRILNEAGNPETFPPSLRSMYFSTLADINIRQERFTEAIDPLLRAIEHTKTRRQKYRLTFLLAQLYGKAGESERAIKEYTSVIKMRPPYEVEFNARINMATVFDASAGDSKGIKNQLLGMIKDDKNKDFLDQIYFALGQLSDKEGNSDEALEYYRKASGTTGTSGNGRGKAYLALAEHYFEIPDYRNSKNFYDSAVYFLDKQYPGYARISTRASNLTDLVVQLETVSREDSLRRVASMNEADRSVLIAGIIQKTREQQMAESSGGSSDMFNLGQFYENERRFRDNIDQEGQWYFYNQAALTFGRTEFRRRWGERSREDNWRRKNKSVAQNIPGQEDLPEGAEADTTLAATDPMSPEFYLRNLPLNDSLVAVSEDRTATALYMAGSVYSDKFQDIPGASRSWLDLVSRFPDKEIVSQAYYRLYLLYRDTDPSRAESYRQSLLMKYPESDYAKILTDPDYFRKQREIEEQAARRYEEAYNLYRGGRLDEALAISGEINRTSGNQLIVPKSRLLYSLILAGLNDEKGYHENLTSVVRDFPGTEEAKRAAELLGVLTREKPELKIEEDRQIAAELYLYEPDIPHLFVLLIENPAFNVNQATFDVINYNIDNHTNRNFRAEGQLVDNKFVIVTVSPFSNAREALEYYSSFSPLTTIRNSSAATTKVFIITAKNLAALKSDKDPARYTLFFREKYIFDNELR
jgi:tetratricopeptide (TPR) repeat protein